MLFPSVAFAVFLPLVFAAYWLAGTSRTRLQNILLIVAGLVFYGWWDYRFVALLLATTGFDYYAGLQLGRLTDERKRRIFFLASVFINLTALCFFKYFNFFSENFAGLMRHVGWRVDAFTLDILLPIGISFYTFHSLSYVIDVYYRRTPACRDASAFFAFISFFPLLVAGPIVRAKWFLPQFEQPRRFQDSHARDGLRQMLWGFFKKMVIADSCAPFVNKFFGHYDTQPAANLVAGAILFTFQIYGDFSGYSDIAIGTSRLFGFSIPPNFHYPFFSRDIAEYWRRWHISLASWFRDYLFTPLSLTFRHWERWGVALAMLINFLLVGLWHGASWTFVVWGGLHAAYFMPLILFRRNMDNYGIPAEGKWLPSLRSILAMMLTFALITFALIFFRAPDIHTAAGYVRHMVSAPWGTMTVERRTWLFIFIMLIAEWLQRDKIHPLQIESLRWRPLRWSVYFVLGLVTFYFGAQPQTFIYFQF
jgi:D-alanyl-lipoteichoic acid acyltransferase DltB (MBOAT superfamily)